MLLGASACDQGRQPPTAPQPVPQAIEVASITLGGTVDSVAVGQSVQLSAAARDASGAPLPNATLRWSSSDETVARVDSTGLVVALARGTASITVRTENRSGAATVRVVAPFGPATVIFAPSGEAFPNPERGIWVYNLYRSNAPVPLSASWMRRMREENVTLIFRLYDLPTFRDRGLSPELLQQLRDDLAAARTAGVKLILRFAYNFNEQDGSIHDAPRALIFQHIDQLAAPLRENADVIDHVQAGFIGRWGEWHTSTNGLANTADKREVLFRLLDVLPASRMVAVRYPWDKRAIFATDQPLSRLEAFDGSRRSRTGHHNDCFLAEATDWGTYRQSGGLSIDGQKTYLAQENRYLVQSGETCFLNPPRSDCPTALKELEQMRWRSLHSRYEPKVVAGWVQQGCYADIERRLGYRFRLVEAWVPTYASPGGSLAMWLTLANDGWGTPYNERSVRIVLRHRENGTRHVLPLEADPRFWVPGEPHTVRLETRLPAGIGPGDYEVLLHLPDPAPTLTERPEYSIRLANEGVWEPQTGYNSLRGTVRVR